jgi:uroporphyrinogen decarboxylase
MERLTSRERVLRAIHHQEPDRVPIDLGAMDSTGITAWAYQRLKDYLGVTEGVPKVIDPYQQVVIVEEAVLTRVRADVLPMPMGPRQWRIGPMAGGLTPNGPGLSSVQYPALWRTEVLPNGSEVALDPAGRPIARRAAAGWHFDPVDPPLARAETVADVEQARAAIEGFDWPFFADQSWDELEAEARRLHNETTYAVMGNFCAHVFAAGQLLRGFEAFMVDLVANPILAEAIMDAVVEAYMRRFERYAAAVGPYVQVINVNDDLGTQDAPQISPGLYRKRIKPYHQKLYRFMKSKCPAAIFLHSDGAIAPLIPDLIDAGVDILNPIQVSARGMDPVDLKREFGRDLVFWGAGCDTQHTLPFGTPDDVRAEVRQRLEALMPGGGFVFNTVHNIQPEVPPENVMAMYETVWEFGGY